MYGMAFFILYTDVHLGMCSLPTTFLLHAVCATYLPTHTPRDKTSTKEEAFSSQCYLEKIKFFILVSFSFSTVDQTT